MTEFLTAPDGVRIAWEVVGEGAPVLLVHGFGSDRVQNWRAPGWYDTLTRAGYSVLALDCRGHGESDKPHDTAAYDESTMVEDIALVMRAAGLTQTAIMGYSMGGSLTLQVCHRFPARISRAIVGGVGDVYFTRSNGWRALIADGILADNGATLSPVQQMFRNFARQRGKDALALAACMRSPREPLSRADLATIIVPALVVCGETDEVSGPPGPLAAALGNASGVTIPRRDHMLTVGDKLYKAAVLEFLGQQNDTDGREK
jgi:pimeloyl-ACP methyl ester carboxylesterase